MMYGYINTKMELFMKFKNLFQMMIVATLITAGSTKCMVVSGLKAVIRHTGNALGITLPLLAPITQSYAYFKIKDKSPEEIIKGLRNPSAEEERFLRQYVKSPNTDLKIQEYTPTPSDELVFIGGLAFNDTCIVVSEKDIFTPTSIEEALLTHDEETLSQKAALIQHEDTHITQKHGKKILLTSIALPIITTGVGVGIARKLITYNKNRSLKRHMGALLLKPIAGFGLGVCNGVAIRTMRHNFEFEADQNISEQYRPAMIKFLSTTNEYQNEQNLYETNLQGEIKKAQIKFLHPSPQERIKRLQATKNS